MPRMPQRRCVSKHGCCSPDKTINLRRTHIRDVLTFVTILFIFFVSFTARCCSRSWSFPAFRERRSSYFVCAEPPSPYSSSES
jgi:hypothetical protein